ncbi:MAG: undecaprenyl/decaprenyl-phosphate alpha-N-acetylglucosaminyl 1-phosphate transferase, partial [Desulfobacula sp.]|nr:undecaprenyl/decaprenyl-phosphate alpha-N-acetylglucosaminyl 1-phosphate transferase [Desulfobacula sp.]
RPLNAKQKIVPQIAAALIVILFGGVKITCLGSLLPEDCMLPWFFSIPLTLFVILGVTNAINLADGLDGLAGGISMLSFVLIGFLAYRCGNMQIALMSTAIVGGILGFLRYNTHPAILFMGDTGSQMLGFLSIVFAIVLTQDNTPYSRILALPIIGFPILDTLTVMVERIIKKRSPFSADKNHFHHRLLRFGFFHTEAVFIIYIIQACFIMLALTFRFYSDWVHILGFSVLSGIILFSVFFARINNLEFNREGYLQTKVKSPLKILKEKNIFIRVSFGCLRYGFPLLLAFQVMIPKQIPTFFSSVAAGLFLMVAASYYFDFFKFKENILRFSTYLVVPLLIYMTENDPAPWMSGFWSGINNTAFLGLVMFILLTMNLTKRQKGFKISPMDILVFIVVLVFPNLPSMQFTQVHVGMILAKILIMFFSHDVIIGELRKQSGVLAKSMLGILGILVLRGFVG